MKKYILSLVLIFAVGQAAYAQNLDELITKLSQIEGIQYQTIDRETMGMMLENSSDIPSFLGKVDYITAAAIEDASPEVQALYTDAFDNFKDGDGYEALLRVSDDEDKVLIVTRKGSEDVNEIFILAISDDELALVKMAGKFDSSDLQEIIDKQNNKK